MSPRKITSFSLFSSPFYSLDWLTHREAVIFFCIIVCQAFHDLSGTGSSAEREIYIEDEVIEILLMTWKSTRPTEFFEAGEQQNVRWSLTGLPVTKFVSYWLCQLSSVCFYHHGWFTSGQRHRKVMSMMNRQPVATTVSSVLFLLDFCFKAGSAPAHSAVTQQGIPRFRCGRVCEHSGERAACLWSTSCSLLLQVRTCSGGSFDVR
jgi:hypothetical protein